MYYLPVLHVVQKWAPICLLIQRPTQSMKHSSWIMLVLIYFPHLSISYTFKNLFIHDDLLSKKFIHDDLEECADIWNYMELHYWDPPNQTLSGFLNGSDFMFLIKEKNCWDYHGSKQTCLFKKRKMICKMTIAGCFIEI